MKVKGAAWGDSSCSLGEHLLGAAKERNQPSLVPFESIGDGSFRRRSVRVDAVQPFDGLLQVVKDHHAQTHLMPVGHDGDQTASRDYC